MHAPQPPKSDLETMRSAYVRGELTEARMERDPIRQLRVWIEDATRDGVYEPNAFCLSTVGAAAQPSARMVLLRGLDDRGLAFYSNYESRKAMEIRDAPRAAATFWWGALERQVRVEGSVERLSEEESDAYFATRPRGHRLSAWASEQSRPIESRELLDERMRDFESRFEDGDVPRPHSWGGFLLRPAYVEFWQGRDNRMHDRIVYERAGSQWRQRRLQP